MPRGHKPQAWSDSRLSGWVSYLDAVTAKPARSAAVKSSPAKGTAKSRAKPSTPRASPTKPKGKSPRRTKEPPPVETVISFVNATVGLPTVVGIDPGNGGAIGFRAGGEYAVVDIPVVVTEVKKTRKTTKKEKAAGAGKTKGIIGKRISFDYAGICELFSALTADGRELRVVLEQVPISMGRGAYADVLINRAYMLWPLYLHSLGCEVTEVPPGDWKEIMGLIGADKEKSRKAAVAMFPDAPLHLVQHHNRAEALLLTEYDRRLRGRK